MVISKMEYDPKNKTFLLKVLTLFDNFWLSLPACFLLCGQIGRVDCVNVVSKQTGSYKQ